MEIMRDLKGCTFLNSLDTTQREMVSTCNKLPVHVHVQISPVASELGKKSENAYMICK